MSDGDGSRLMKYGVAATLLALYAGISAWIVASEGEGYREAYRKTIALRSAPPAPPTAIALNSPNPAKPPEPEVAKEPEPAPAPVAPVKPEPVAEDQPPRPARVDPPKPRAPAKTPAPASSSGPPVDHFWDEPAQQKVWDIEKLTVDDERALGLALHEMVLHDHPKVKAGGSMLKRLQDAAKPYLAARTRQDLDYKFTVLDCPRMNVFSHPGGYIYVCKGLFDWISEDKDYALEFLIAHEIRHVDQAHAITCLKSPSVKDLKLGTVTMFYAVVIPAGYYPEQMDLDADRWAANQMMKAGRTRFQTLAFIRRLQDYAKTPENDFENERKKPNDEPRVPLLDNHIRAHPYPSQRLDELKAIIDGPKI